MRLAAMRNRTAETAHDSRGLSAVTRAKTAISDSTSPHSINTAVLTTLNLPEELASVY